MATTAQLLINITANASEAQASMASASSAVEQVGKRAGEAQGLFGRFGEELQSIGKIAVGMATGIAAAELTIGIAERFKSAAEQIDVYGQAVLRVQRISGGSAEAASTLVAIFERYSPSLDDATTRLAKFERALAGQEDVLDIAAPGGKTAAAYLREFGVTATDANGKLLPTLNILEQLADGFKNSGDEAQKNAALTALFGRGSQSMLLLLNQGAAGLEATAAAAKQYGLTLTGENLADVQAFAFAHKDMDMALQGVALQLGAAFMPAVTSAAQGTANLAKELNQGLLPAMKAIADSPGTPVILAFASAAAVMTGSAKLLVAAATPIASLLGTIGSAAGVGAGAMLTLAGAIGAVVGAFAVAGTLADKMAEFAQSRGVPDWGVALIRQIAPPGAADLVDAAKQAKSDIDALIGQGSATTAGPEELALGEGGETVSPGIKAATAATDTAKAQLQALSDAAAVRKASFDIASLSDAQQLLDLKSSEVNANSALVESKRQIEDLDRNAVNFGRQRLQLEQERASLLAQQAESPLKAASQDIAFQESEIKAEIAASRHGGPAVDSGALRRQLHELQNQDRQLQPGLLTAEHNVTLADRAKAATGLDASLAANTLAGQKLDVTEAMAPAEAAAVMAKRAVEDQQHVVDLEKQRFDLLEKGFAAETAIATAREKGAAAALFLAQHADVDRSGITINIGDVTHGGHSDEMLQKVIEQITAAWNAATQGTPVAGPMGGAFTMGSAPR